MLPLVRFGRGPAVAAPAAARAAGPRRRAIVSVVSPSVTAAVAERVRRTLVDRDELVRLGLPKAKYFLKQGQSIAAELAANAHVDPFELAKSELSSLSAAVKELVGSDNAVLSSVAGHFFSNPGKRIRPTVVLLAGMAIGPRGQVDASQRRLSEITELIHTASLLHDDVIDDADQRRGVPSVNAKFGNKLAILGGDFLLARASMALARLRNTEVVELLSTVIEHLVKGEVMQMRPPGNSNTSPIDHYLAKSFYKTASLMAHSCKACAVLGGHDTSTQEILFEYGKHLGLTFQIVDDLLDFVGKGQEVGKPVQHDLRTGLATAPILYAADEHPELAEMIARRFSVEEDVEKAISLVHHSSALDSTRLLAEQCAGHAVAAASLLPESPARAALINLVGKTLTRRS